MKTRCDFDVTGCSKNRSIRSATIVTSGNPSAVTFCRQVSAAAREDSTKVTPAAPRLAASSSSAPEPAYRSSTRAPSSTPRCSSREKTASRTRSEVGRVPRSGTRMIRPPAVPATIRVMRTA
jgi:hypothetical protein